MIYVLSYQGVPVAASYRFERLNMAAADYTAAQQADLKISDVEVVV